MKDVAHSGFTGSTHSAPWFLTLFTARLGNKTGEPLKVVIAARVANL